MNYIQICNNCGSDMVAIPEWVNVNTDEPISGDPGVYTKWCFECEDQTKIIDENEASHCELKDD